jgi:FkbM family methyltransferase
MSDPLFDLLAPSRLTAVVDIGANPIDGVPPYREMLASGLCTVVGFEPQVDKLAELDRRKGPNERYFADAIGDGAEQTLYICRASGMTSTLQPDPTRLRLFNMFSQWGEVKQTQRIATRRLDDIAEIDHLDLLKMDIQGGELRAIRNARRKLADAVAIQVEVSFVELYRDQPGFGEVDRELRGLGFLPHCFAELKMWPIAPITVAGNPGQPVRQLLEGDIVYVRDFSKPKQMSGEQWKHLAMIAHHCYGSIDLALRSIVEMARTGLLPSGAAERYLAMLPTYAAQAKKPAQPRDEQK